MFEKKRLLSLLFGCAFLAAGCASGAPNTVESPVQEEETERRAELVDKTVVGEALQCEYTDAIKLYESWPVETTLDNAHIDDVSALWVNIIDCAKESLDFSHFYAITAPNTDLDAVIQAIHRAADRGVKVRFMVDKAMLKDDNAYLPQEIATWKATELRIIDYNSITGGVQHAKYFIADKTYAYFGSQNFDWRSLEHISEMGALLTNPQLVKPLIDAFETDWQLTQDTAYRPEPMEYKMPVTVDYKGEESVVRIALSPKEVLSDEASWDLPMIVELIEQATTRVDIQLLNYATLNYDKTQFKEIDDALIAAAQRGVRVRLMVSDWSKRSKYLSDLKRLEQIENIETKMIVVPEHSAGFIPFARTIHSKFMLVDDKDAWLGTSNWSGDYFYNSRNVGMVVHGANFNADLSQSFDAYWDSEYAESTDPHKNYEPRRQY